MSTKPRQRGAVAVAALVLAVAASPIAAAQDNVPNPVTGFSQNRKEPMNIEALKLEVRDKQKIATFTGNVVVVQGDTTLKCKVLVVYYDNNDPKKPPGAKAIKTSTPGPQGSQQIRRLEAKGDVIVTQKDQVATGDLGIFDTKSNTVTLSGNVVINQGPNVTRGDRLVVDLTTGVSRVDAGSGPVRMLIQQRPATKEKPAEQPKAGPGRRL
jgi:lipopolysaccharide export system protein LptA